MTKPSHSIEDLKGHGQERFHAIDWTVQRCCWCACAAILVAALLGFFGQGPLVHRRIPATDDSLSVEYYAVERYGSPTKMSFHIRQPTTGPVKLRISKRFCEETSEHDFLPVPARQVVEEEEIVYEFARQRRGDTDIVLRYQHQEPGRLAYEVAVIGHEPIAIRQYVLP